MPFNKHGVMVILSSPSGAGKTTLVKMLSKIDNFEISISHTTRTPRPNENPGEQSIRLVKLRLYRYAHRRQIPKQYWDYLLVWICETGNLTASSSKYSKGRTPLEIITGITRKSVNIFDLYCTYIPAV